MVFKNLWQTGASSASGPKYAQTAQACPRLSNILSSFLHPVQVRGQLQAIRAHLPAEYIQLAVQVLVIHPPAENVIGSFPLAESAPCFAFL